MLLVLLLDLCQCWRPFAARMGIVDAVIVIVMVMVITMTPRTPTGMVLVLVLVVRRSHDTTNSIENVIENVIVIVIAAGVVIVRGIRSYRNYYGRLYHLPGMARSVYAK